MNMLYPYTVEPDEDGYLVVQFIDMQDVFTQGENLEDAAFNAVEVLNGMLEWKLENNQDIPAPSACPAGAFLACPSTKIQAALLLKTAKRFEKSKRPVSLSQLDKAAKVLGKRLVLSVE
jgi:antitoxin HicB